MSDDDHSPSKKDCERKLRNIATKVGAEKCFISWGNPRLGAETIINLNGDTFGLWVKNAGFTKKEVWHTLRALDWGIGLGMGKMLTNKVESPQV